MKKHILLLFIVFYSITAAAQTRKHIGNFSQVRSFYNPAFTADQDSRLTGLYRNQWTGFEDAPKTILATAEFNFLDLKKAKNYNLNQVGQSTDMQHGIGLQLFRESFGPHAETQATITYGAGIQVSEKLRLRWGGAVAYTSLVLDGSKLTVDQENDPKYTRLMGQNNRSGKLDLNLGLGLSAGNFYVGYAMQGITKGKLLSTGEDYLQDMFERRHIGQVGYRADLTPDLGLIVNGIYQHDSYYDATLEGQLKAVYQQFLWAGAGYRNNQAFTATAGIKLNNLEVSYLYESPVADAETIDKPTNEVTVAYILRAKRNNSPNRPLQIW